MLKIVLSKLLSRENTEINVLCKKLMSEGWCLKKITYCSIVTWVLFYFAKLRRKTEKKLKTLKIFAKVILTKSEAKKEKPISRGREGMPCWCHIVHLNCKDPSDLWKTILQSDYICKTINNTSWTFDDLFIIATMWNTLNLSSAFLLFSGR